MNQIVGTAAHSRHNDARDTQIAAAGHQLDDTDRTIIALLANDARMPLATLARRLHLARSTVQGRLERLERSGAIAGYTLRLGDAVRPGIRATVLLTAEPRAQAALIARLRSIPEVERCVTTSGRFDLAVVVAAASTARLDAVLDGIGDLQGVRASESLIHLSTKIERIA